MKKIMLPAIAFAASLSLSMAQAQTVGQDAMPPRP